MEQMTYDTLNHNYEVTIILLHLCFVSALPLYATVAIVLGAVIIVVIVAGGLVYR